MDLCRSLLCIAGLSAAIVSGSAMNFGQAKAQPVDGFRDCADCPAMVQIPVGAFVMGTTDEDLSKSGVPEPFASYQMPTHDVELTRAFAIGKYPVTKAEYLTFVNETGRQEPDACWSWNVRADRYEQQEGFTWTDPGFAQTDRDPVVCVSWTDAQAYVEWLSQVTGASYRLPSESEREYVTRAGAMTAWPWGDEATAICAHANISDLSRIAIHTSTKRTSETVFDCEDGYVYTSPVGTYEANEFGLYDTLGNVWEWQADCFKDSYAGALQDGASELGEPCDLRALRGGSWFTFTFLNRPAARYGTAPDDRSGHVGFRVARSIE